MGKQPQGDDQGYADDDDQDALHVHIGAEDDEASVHKDRQGIVKPHKAQIAEEFQNGQPDAEGGDHLGKRLPAHADQDQAVQQGAAKGTAGNGNQHRQRIGQTQQMHQHPGGVGGQHVEGPIGEIGHPADAESQIESHGHQGQDNTIDNGIDSGSDDHWTIL